MNLSHFAVKRPVAAIMIFLALTLLGLTSARRLAVDLLPDLSYPVFAVRTDCSGMAPLDIENRVTRQVEEAVSSVPGIIKLTSTSSDEVSVVTVEFAWGTDMNFAALHVREKLDQQAAGLPEQAERPTIVKLDTSAEPVIVLAVSSSSLLNTKRLAENIIKRRLEQIEGVAAAQVTGGVEREIHIDVDMERAAGLNISMDEIARALNNANYSFPGGTIRKGRFRYSLRTLGEYQSLDDIRNVVVADKANGALVHLKQIAQVTDGIAERTGLVRLDQKEAVGILIVKEAGANTVAVSKLVKSVLKELAAQYPELSISEIYNQANFISMALSNVKQAIIFGSVLAVVILFLFLPNVRSPLVIGTSIPVSVITGFILFDIFHVQLNIMSLGGLALGVGLLVDNSIIVLENIFRLKESGMDKFKAAWQGAYEVAMPLLASTLTTIAVFLPITYIEGVAGRLFRDLAFAVSCSLLASLLVALTLVPVLANLLLSRKLVNIKIFEKQLDKVFNIYETGLNKVLAKPKRTLVYAGLLLLLSMLAFAGVKQELMPSTPSSAIIAELQLPKGASLEWVTEATAQLEQKFSEYKYVSGVFSQVGLARYGAESATDQAGLENSRLRVQFIKGAPIEHILTDVKSSLILPPGAELAFKPEENLVGQLFSLNDGDIEISVSGADLIKINSILESVKPLIEQTAGIKSVWSNYSQGMPEIRLTIDQEMAGHYGVSISTIADIIEKNINGVLLEPLNEFDRKTTIRLRAEYLQTDDQLATLLERTVLADSTAIPLKTLIHIENGRSPSRIKRVSQARQLSLFADSDGRSVKPVIAKLQDKMSDIDLPTGYELHIGGVAEEMKKTFRDLIFALVLSIALVYMILAGQFESLRHPFLIILSIPMALIGVVWALLLTGVSLNILSFIGVIVLVGISVNDAIVKIDFINQRRKEGLELLPAILNAGKMRFRPIVMTSVTTILGMAPLALSLGPGGLIGKPLAVAIMGGLFSSTVLTLIVIPVLYYLFEKKRAGL